LADLTLGKLLSFEKIAGLKKSADIVINKKRVEVLLINGNPYSLFDYDHIQLILICH